MIDKTKRLEKEQAKAKTKKRIYVEVDPENYDYFPETRQADYYDNDVPQRVAIYVRVSTDDVRQTTSFELQKKYYEDFVIKHPHWTLVKIYADEGISGTSLNKREQFLQMISDAKRGKIDMIITKSVSRFARNIYDFIGIVRDLAERNPPVGVFFESEGIFSLNDDSQLALSFQATMAEEESHTRSRSMETSLRMRLDNGIPLTPKLLGYMHDADGTLIPNPDEAPTVKLAFYIYHLYKVISCLGIGFPKDICKFEAIHQCVKTNCTGVIFIWQYKWSYFFGNLKRIFVGKCFIAFSLRVLVDISQMLTNRKIISIKFANLCDKIINQSRTKSNQFLCLIFKTLQAEYQFCLQIKYSLLDRLS